MIKIWDDFVKKEELVLSPGVIDENRVRALSLNTYLTYIKEMIEMGESQFPDMVSEQLEDVMADIFISYTHTFEDRYPEPAEISAYLKTPENVEALKNLSELCVNADAENWPEVERQMQEIVPVDDLDKINWDSEERKQNEEKWRKRFEQDGFVEL